MFDGGEASNNNFQRSSSRNADLEFGCRRWYASVLLIILPINFPSFFLRSLFSSNWPDIDATSTHFYVKTAKYLLSQLSRDFKDEHVIWNSQYRYIGQPRESRRPRPHCERPKGHGAASTPCDFQIKAFFNYCWYSSTWRSSTRFRDSNHFSAKRYNKLEFWEKLMSLLYSCNDDWRCFLIALWAYKELSWRGWILRS